MKTTETPDAASEVTVRITGKPIFIIGSPRSGTTALAASLQRHDALWTAEESQILWDLFGSGRLLKNYRREGVADGSWLVKRGVEPATFLSFIGLGLNVLFTTVSGGRRWIDHTPTYTFLLPDLAAIFPGALFVHILRDGRRVVHSMMHFLARFGDEAFPEPWARDFREACRTWRRYVEVALAFERAAPARCLTVRNEDLVANPAQGFARLYAFLELEPEPAPIEFFRSQRINSSFGDGSRTSVPTESRAWSSWTDEQRSVFMAEAGETLAACGFLEPGLAGASRTGEAGEVRGAGPATATGKPSA